jgi:hypothetical protein
MRNFPMGKQPKTVREHGIQCYRDFAAEMPGGSRSQCWPMKSWALGVHPKQRVEAQQFAAAKGVHCEFDRNGDAILRSQKHRAEVCRAFDLFDRNAGYGDAAPNNL